MSHNGRDDIAARLRDEAAATAPERLRADVMLRVHAEPRPRRIHPRRSFQRSFVSVAAAACILGALVFGMSRVDFGGGGSAASGGGSAAAEKSLGAAYGAAGAGTKSALIAPSRTAVPHRAGAPLGFQSDENARRAFAVPRPLRAAVLPRYELAAPLRRTFGAIDPHHGRARR